MAMSNLMDRAQEREQLDRDLALREQGRKKTQGLSACEECGKPISDLRQELGARFCVEHQLGVEAEAKRRTTRCAI